MFGAEEMSLGPVVSKDSGVFCTPGVGGLNRDVSFNTVEIISLVYGGIFGFFNSLSRKLRESSSRSTANMLNK